MTKPLSPAAKWMLKWHIWSAVSEELLRQREEARQKHEHHIKISLVLEEVLKKVSAQLEKINGHDIHMAVGHPDAVPSNGAAIEEGLRKMWFTDVSIGNQQEGWWQGIENVMTIKMSVLNIFKKLLKEENSNFI